VRVPLKDPGSLFLTPRELAQRYGGRVSVKTLANWRWQGLGPPFVKLGGRVLYPVTDLLGWELDRTRGGADGDRK
jgi:hypothetical protein